MEIRSKVQIVRNFLVRGLALRRRFPAQWRIVVNALASGLIGPRSSHPGHATILLGSNLGQVVYSHCLPSLLSSKKLEYKGGT